MASAQGRQGIAPEFVRESDLLRGAFALADEAHSGQRRRAGDPYVSHPVEIALRLREVGVGDAAVAAALLHDVVEDTDLGLGDVVERFGVEVGELVAALTEDPAIEPWTERKGALREQVAESGPSAAEIYAVDKLSNVIDLRRLLAQQGEEAAASSFPVPLDVRIQAWREDLAMASRLLPAFPPVDELSAELEGLERDRSESRRGSELNSQLT
jgi:(p)ppGpp synthase/HD superfamily hydrolase